jgi:hypothetical protein
VYSPIISNYPLIAQYLMPLGIGLQICDIGKKISWGDARRIALEVRKAAERERLEYATAEAKAQAYGIRITSNDLAEAILCCEKEGQDPGV